jgi:hypothetical protein
VNAAWASRGQQNLFVDEANVDLDVFFHGSLAVA